MPYRITPLVKDNYYHILNRGLNRQPTFTTPRKYSRALAALWYYRFQNTQISLHSFIKLNDEAKNFMSNRLQNEDIRHVDVISYCLMPNHFHLLLKQLTDNGISKFVGNFQNSYTRYFNIRKNLQGAIFTTQFKAVLVETDEQLLHLSRYIHLNPYSSSIVSTLERVLDYPYSSFGGILGRRRDRIISGLDIIMSNFKKKNAYEKFVLSQADYQKRLQKIKHMLLED